MRSKKIISGIIALTMTLSSASLLAQNCAVFAAAESTTASSSSTSEYIRSGDWDYSINSDGTVTLERYKYTGLTSPNNGIAPSTYRDVTLTVPSEIDGYTVKKIGKNVNFLSQSENDERFTIIIPDTVTAIYCRLLLPPLRIKEIRIPASVTYIAAEYLNPSNTMVMTSSDSPNYLNVVIDPGNRKYCYENGLLMNKSKTTLFANLYMKSDVNFTVPDGVTTLGEFGCTKQGVVTIPDSVTVIEDHALATSSYGNWSDPSYYNFVSNRRVRCNKNSYAESYCQQNDIYYTTIGEPKDISGFSVEYSNSISTDDSGIYNGNGVYSYSGLECRNPYAYVIKDGSYTLMKNLGEYDLSFSNNIFPGTGTATITGTGDFGGSITKNITIKKLDMSDYIMYADYEAAAASFAAAAGNAFNPYLKPNVNMEFDYTGSSIKPFSGSISALYQKKDHTFTSDYVYNETTGVYEPVTKSYFGYEKTTVDLIEGRDYTVTYSNNTNVGTASYTITGKNNCFGTITGTFEILPAGSSSLTDISSCTATLGSTTLYYNGSALKPSVTVKNGTTTLTNGTDYTVTYSNNINAGTGKVTITGKGNYKGTVTKTFTIKPRSIGNCDTSLASSSVYFRGTRIKPAVTVKNGSKTLTQGTDYTVAYYDNLSVGTARAVITGKGNYTGTVTKTFKIEQRSIGNCDIVLGADSYYFNGTRIKPSVKVYCNGVEMYNGNYTVSYANNLSAGTASITLTGKNNLKGTVTKTFKINPRNIGNCTVTLTKNTANKYQPTVSVKIGDSEIYSGNYTVTYKTSTDKKTVAVTLTGKNNLSGSVTKTYTVS